MSNPLTRLNPDQLTAARARMTAGEYRAEDVEALFEHLEALTEELRDAAPSDNNLLIDLLQDTAIALEGPAAPNKKHSVHRLPELAAAWKGRAEEAECFTKILPCVELDEPPFDFKSCVTHDRTYALDEVCDYAGKSVVTYLEDTVVAQRFRAITAEDRAAAAAAAAHPNETSAR